MKICANSEEMKICANSEECCKELTRVWDALHVTTADGLSASEHVTRLTRERDEARAALTALQSYQVQYDDLQDENAKLQGERDAARTQASAFAHAAAEARETAYDLRALLRDMEWDSVGACRLCHGPAYEHEANCRLKAALEG